VKGRVRGALILEVPHGSALDDEQVRVARRLANQAANALEDIRLVGELEDMSWGGIRALARAIDAKSPWTTGHSERVTQVALALGREMELPAHELDQLHRGGLLHDIGKIGVPSAILNADRRLTDEEAEQVRRHPEIGARIIEPIRAYLPIVPLVLQHHERWDGRGYPAGLAGEEIHPLARILAVADTYDAMVSARPYRAARPLEATIAEIVGGAGSQFEPRVVRAFVAFAARATTTERSLEKVHA
jgi:putative nucleotidyltransferase with HDIG domain